MNPFRFEPILFAHRAKAMDALGEAGFEWFSHFSSLDILHDVFGLEVCGIDNQELALNLRSVLCQIFPTWKYSRLIYRNGELDPGWKVIIHRDPEADPSVSLEA
jgi:hypothetical protein